MRRSSWACTALTVIFVAAAAWAVVDSVKPIPPKLPRVETPKPAEAEIPEEPAEAEIPMEEGSLV